MPPDSCKCILNRIRQSLGVVGPKKAVGYLPLYTISEVLGAELDDLVGEAESQGLSTIVLGPDRCCIKSGALYVYHRAALEKLLRQAADVVQNSGLSSNPEQFVEQIAATWFEPEEPIYPVIKAAFSDLH
jgi:hypothetical protein